MRFIIIGTFRGKREVLDEAKTRKEAISLKSEYQMAYGNNWKIEVKKN